MVEMDIFPKQMVEKLLQNIVGKNIAGDRKWLSAVGDVCRKWSLATEDCGQRSLIRDGNESWQC